MLVPPCSGDEEDEDEEEDENSCSSGAASLTSFSSSGDRGKSHGETGLFREDDSCFGCDCTGVK